MTSIDELAVKAAQIAATKGRPVVMAIDGGSGAGKSTIANAIRLQTGAALVTLDDFLNTSVPDHAWAALPVERRLGDVFEWVRVREHALEPLLAGKPGRWQAFDFISGPRSDGTYGMNTDFTEVVPASLVLIEGAYSASPPLANLVDLTVLVDVPVEERHRRTDARDEPEFLRKWHETWDEVERYYFETIRPPHMFDYLIRND